MPIILSLFTLNYEETKDGIKTAYALINTVPVDRLDCLSKALQIQNVLGGGIVFLNEVAASPHRGEFTKEDLEYIHESFCDSAIPIVQMIEYFSEKMEKGAREHSLAV